MQSEYLHIIDLLWGLQFVNGEHSWTIREVVLFLPFKDVVVLPWLQHNFVPVQVRRQHGVIVLLTPAHVFSSNDKKKPANVSAV